MLGAFVHLPTLLGSQFQFLESAMDDDKEKSVIEKMVVKSMTLSKTSSKRL